MLNNMKILMGLLIVIAGLAYWVLLDNNHGEIEQKQALIPSWQDNDELINAIDHVVLSKNGETISLMKTADNWQVNDGFYASIEPLFTLLQALKNAEIIEAKTANPENHAQVELAENDLLVKLYSGGELQHALHLGKQTTSGLTFVRMADENQTYAVQGIQAVSFSQDSWLLKTVLDYAANDIIAVELTPVSGDKVMIHRDPESGSWSLDNLPADFQLQANVNLNEMAGGLSRLMIDQALPAEVDSENLKLSANYQLLNGIEIDINVYQQDEQYYMTIDSAHYPHYKGWMMQIAEYKFNALNRQLSDLIEPAVALDENAEQVEAIVE